MNINFERMPPVWVRGPTLVASDVEADLRFSESTRAAYGAIEVRSFVSVPLVRQNKLVWALSVVSNRPCERTSGEVNLIEEAGERTWDAAERAAIEHSIRQRHKK